MNKILEICRKADCFYHHACSIKWLFTQCDLFRKIVWTRLKSKFQKTKYFHIILVKYIYVFLNLKSKKSSVWPKSDFFCLYLFTRIQTVLQTHEVLYTPFKMMYVSMQLPVMMKCLFKPPRFCNYHLSAKLIKLLPKPVCFQLNFDPCDLRGFVTWASVLRRAKYAHWTGLHEFRD